MKKRMLALALVLVLCIGLLTVSAFAERHEPELVIEPVVVGRLASSSQNAPNDMEFSTFTDMTDDDWYYKAAYYCTEKGLLAPVDYRTFGAKQEVLSGTVMEILAHLAGVETQGSPKFQRAQEWLGNTGIDQGMDPEGVINRQDLAELLMNYANYRKFDSVPAEDGMSWAVANGILEGAKGELMPEAIVNRGQLAVILMRFCEAF